MSRDDQIGGQLAAGFVLAGFFEDNDPSHPLAKFLPTFIAIPPQPSNPFLSRESVGGQGKFFSDRPRFPPPRTTRRGRSHQTGNTVGTIRQSNRASFSLPGSQTQSVSPLR